MEDFPIELAVSAVLIAVGLIAGTLNEQRHLKHLRSRETATRHISVINFGARQALPDTRQTMMCVGSVVISSDYFKTFLAGLISLFGGRISIYEVLLERARREAVLRMKEQAIRWGAKQILNVRLETASLNTESTNGIIAIEAIAYGTAVR